MFCGGRLQGAGQTPRNAAGTGACNMNRKIISRLALACTMFALSHGGARAGILFEAVKTVGKEIVHKAVSDDQERRQRAWQQQQRAQQMQAQQRRAQQQQRVQQQPQQQQPPAVQANPTAPAEATPAPAAVTAPTGSEL